MNLEAFIFILLCHILHVHAKISCKDENNHATDWYAVYKLPKIETESPESVVGQGEGYAYLDVGKSRAKWVLSGKAISSKDSIFGNTLKELYDNKEDLTYLLYNDDPVDEDAGSSAGHTKGVLVFDEDTGFWLIHSVPKFPPVDSYEYPSSGLQNGQSALCITFKTEELNEIGKQLLYNAPNIYDKGYQSSVLSTLEDDVRSLFSGKMRLVRKPPFTRTADLTSAGGVMFTSFAKDNQFNEDLYDAFVAPKLRTSLYVETWRRGSGTPMDPSCEIRYNVQDIKSVNITVHQKSKRKHIGFQSTEDHSKWAVSSNSRNKWICVGDINRMESQTKRGGGTVCFVSSPTWAAYSSMIVETDQC